MTRIRVRGVTDETDLAVVGVAGVDAVGAVYDVPVDTPREIPCRRARELFVAASPFLTTALVTIPGPVDRARDLAHGVGPDVLQFHDDFAAGGLGSLRATGVGIIPAVDATDLAHAHDLMPVVDTILVDAPSDSDANDTGEVHDWDTSRDPVTAVDTPVILTGGPTPDNVVEAIRAIEPYGIDVTSSVETSGKVKDHGTTRVFVTATKTAYETAGDHEGVVAWRPPMSTAESSSPSPATRTDRS